MPEGRSEGLGAALNCGPINIAFLSKWTGVPQLIIVVSGLIVRLISVRLQNRKALGRMLAIFIQGLRS
jgi:hypothetical protein